MTSKFEIGQGIRGPAVRCGLHDKTLQAKRLQIADAIGFLQEVEREIGTQRKDMQLVHLAGIVAWSAIIVTNIIRNTVKVTPAGKGARVVLMVLDEAHGKASEHRFDGNRHAEEIKHIEDAKEALRKSLPPGGGELANLFGDMAMDFLGMTGFLQDAQETDRSLSQSIDAAKRQLRDARELLRKIDARIADDALSDDGGTTAPMSGVMTPAAPVWKLH